MAWGTWVQSQVESFQRLKKWYLMPPCLILNIIRYGSRVKWVNPGKRLAPSSTPWCSSYPSGHPQLLWKSNDLPSNRAAFLNLLDKGKPAKLTSFIGEHLMQQVCCSVVPGWPAQHICVSGVYSPIYSSSKWQWESFYLCVRPLSTQPIFFKLRLPTLLLLYNYQVMLIARSPLTLSHHPSL